MPTCCATRPYSRRHLTTTISPSLSSHQHLLTSLSRRYSSLFSSCRLCCSATCPFHLGSGRSSSLFFTPTRYGRMKTRKASNNYKMDAIRKKFPNHTELAYREAVSKLKYFLAESYAPRSIIPKPFYAGKRSYRENTEDYIDDNDNQSIISEASKREASTTGNKYYTSRLSSFPPTTVVRTQSYSTTTGNNEKSLAPAAAAAAPPPPPPPTELLSFIERQEEYIEQLERESQYCKDELKGLLEKVKEVVAENEALQDKYKSGMLKSVFDSWPDQSPEENNDPRIAAASAAAAAAAAPLSARKTVSKPLEGPSIVFESRIAELEAQLTQARLELRKAREESQANLGRLSELRQEAQQPQIELERASRERRELETKVEELKRELGKSRARDAEVEARNKRAAEQAHQAEFDKVQAEAEVRRLREELERRQDKLREALQETNRRIADEKLQVERRFSQQMEQLSADMASHWEAASKSHLESEKQRREIADLKREIAQKQAYFDDLKKEMQLKTAKMQEELNEAIAQKDASQEEVATVKLTAERSERQARQEQARLQAEINSYKMRLERADADLVHARRENLRLGEEIATLEKEINMSKLIGETRVGGQTISKDKSKDDRDKDKELASLIFDLENKQAKTVASLEESLNKQASLVSRLTAECQSLTQRLEANDQKHKKEMASLQDNIEFLSSSMKESFELRVNNNSGEQDKTITSSEQNSSGPIESDSKNLTFDKYNFENKTVNKNPIINPSTFSTQPSDDVDLNKKYSEQQENYGEDYSNQHYNQYDQYDPNQYPEYFSEQQYSETHAQDGQYLDNKQNYEDYINKQEK